MNNRQFYDEYWSGTDFPAAYQAFISGKDSALIVISKYLADQPSNQEDAISEYTWLEKLKEVFENENNQEVE